MNTKTIPIESDPVCPEKALFGGVCGLVAQIIEASGEKRDLGSENRRLRITLETSERVDEILSDIYGISGIRKLFDYVFSNVPKILGSEVRFHFTDMRDAGIERGDSLDNLVEIFRWSLRTYAEGAKIEDIGKVGSVVEFHDSDLDGRIPKNRYFPIVLPNFTGGPECDGIVNTRIGFLEIPRVRCWKGIIDPENILKKVVWSLQTHFERFQNVLLRRELSNLANEDHMISGIHNRRGFFQKADRLRKERPNEPSAVVALDLDHFKNVNDTYGHDAGDGALRFVAGKILASIPNELRDSAVVARFWGEEFVLYVHGKDTDWGYHLAEDIRRMIASQPFRTTDASIGITVSLGVADGRNSGEPIENLLVRADKAMYWAKGCGRNRVELFEEYPSIPSEKDSIKKFTFRESERDDGKGQRSVPDFERRHTVQSLVAKLMEEEGQ